MGGYARGPVVVGGAPMTDTPLPTPGSDAAVARGCTCAVWDNHHGAGFPYGGETCFWISADCPLHGNYPGKSDSSEA